MSDKVVKAEFRKKASKEPDKFYPTSVLKAEGFARKQCTNCSKFFWTVTDSKVCGDPGCSGGFRFIGASPAKNKMDYVELWKKFSDMFKKLGYTPIVRYPVTARWRDDIDYVFASICDFQPYVVTGEVEPPANPLVVPQFSMRFNDIDNVGITGAHYTGFVMIGQHAFMPPKDWNQAKYFKDIHSWLKQGLGLPNEEITFHEDAWAGGGNFGPCMEFFSRGLELGNQVYMLYEQTPSGPKELNLKVLDMGMGQERNAWFSSGTSTSYETTFPSVMDKLYKIAGINPDNELMLRFLPYASYLNVDEASDLEKAWNDIANKLKIDVKELREKITTLASLYSVAEHSRTLLVALTDGTMPSNVGGGYNLRMLFRRAQGMIDKFGWKTDIHELCREHADYLKPQFPELREELDEVRELLEVEKRKYKETKVRAGQTVANIIKKNVTADTLVELYDSQGISPDIVKDEALKLGKIIKIPDDFYLRLQARHEQKEKKVEKKSTLDVSEIPATKRLYYGDYTFVNFEGTVLKFVGDAVILDKSAFYPTSGGQMHDLGTLNGHEVTNIFSVGNVVVHIVPGHHFKKNEMLRGQIDFDRRLQLAQHHTSTHILNGAARKVLGNHIWQAGAEKDVDKSRIDITHYEQLTEEQIMQIEDVANDIVSKNIPVNKSFIPRGIAESKYGFRIYQGGAVPGKDLRIVDIPGFDVEACGGTHLDLTGEAIKIKILKTSKIQDGIVRIEFVAGKAADKIRLQDLELIENVALKLKCSPEAVPNRISELFEKWKSAKKIVERISDANYLEQIKSGQVKPDLEFGPEKNEQHHLVEKAAANLKTQPEHLLKTVERFIGELNEYKKQIKEKLR